jgi:hypothetical protein
MKRMLFREGWLDRCVITPLVLLVPALKYVRYITWRKPALCGGLVLLLLITTPSRGLGCIKRWSYKQKWQEGKKATASLLQAGRQESGRRAWVRIVAGATLECEWDHSSSSNPRYTVSQSRSDCLHYTPAASLDHYILLVFLHYTIYGDSLIKFILAVQEFHTFHGVDIKKPLLCQCFTWFIFFILLLLSL